MPSEPIVTPTVTKTFIIPRRLAPMVRRIAMSRVLARTSMISEDRMLNTATRTISDRTTNIATRSTSSASNRAEFICRQSTTTPWPRTHRRKRREDLLDPVGVGGLDLDDPDLVAHHQQRLGVLHRHDHECLVIIVDADLEHRADGIGDDPRHRADHGRAAFGADQADLGSRIGAERLGQPRADRDLVAARSDRS